MINQKLNKRRTGARAMTTKLKNHKKDLNRQIPKLPLFNNMPNSVSNNANNVVEFKPKIKHLAHVDKQETWAKPQKEKDGKTPAFRDMSLRFNRTQAQYLTLEQIAKYNVTGHAVIFSKFQGVRSLVNFKQTDILVLDVDFVPSPEELFFAIKDEAAYIYETLRSNTEDFGFRCRIIYQMNTVITKADVYKRIADIKAQELESKLPGIDIDRGSMDVIHIFLPGKNLLEINYENELDGKSIQIEAEKQLEKERKLRHERKLRQLESVIIYTANYQELKEMAEHIGFVEDYGLWIKLGHSLKSYVEEGHITDNEGFELWAIMSDDYYYDKWDSINISDTSNNISIGTFIYHAQKKGYKRTFHHLPVKPTQILTNTLSYNNYISECEQISEMIVSKERILVESATGSGKSYAFVEAMKQAVCNLDTFFFFVTPTRALTEQISRERNIPCIIGSTSDKSDKNKKKAWATVHTAIKNEQRVFAVIYDMVKPLYEMLVRIENNNNNINVHMVVDEYHKLLNDYGYRRRAIREVLEIEEKAKTVIGLSGTPQEIDLSRFNQMIIFKQNKTTPIFNAFIIISSNKKAHPRIKEGKDEYLADLSFLLKTRATKGYKVLTFLNNKEEIAKLKRLLQKEGIRVSVITSESKNNDIYKKIVDTGKIPEEIQVILATTVIADGISIRNENSKFDVIVVANAMSNLFKATTMKQISHRLRNRFENFIVFTKEYVQDVQIRVFNVEGLYQYTLNLSEAFLSELNTDGGFDVEKFYRSHVEKEYGLYREADCLTVDKYLLRHIAFQHKDAFMSSKPQLLVAELEKIFNVNAQYQKVTEIIEDTMKAEVSQIQMELRKLEELQKLRNSEKRKAFPTAFTKDVFAALQWSESAPLAQEFKKAVPADMYKAAVTISGIASYEQTKHLVSQITKPSQTNEFVNSLESLFDNLMFESNTTNNKTNKIIKEIQNLIGTLFTKTEIKAEQSRIAKKHKIKEAIVKQCFANFVIEHEREGHDRIRKTKIIRLKDEKCLATQFDLPVNELMQIAYSYLEVKTYKNRYKMALKKVFENRHAQYFDLF